VIQQVFSFKKRARGKREAHVGLQLMQVSQERLGLDDDVLERDNGDCQQVFCGVAGGRGGG
jgi:hypothetical protein